MSRSIRPTAGMMLRGRIWYWRRCVAGKEVWRSLGPDLREAVQRARELDARYPQAASAIERATMSTVLDRWMAVYVATYRTPKNQRLAKQRVDDYIRPEIGAIMATALTRDHVRRFRLALEAREGMSVQTVAHILSDLRCCLRWAQDAGYVETAPIPSRMLPRVAAGIPRALSEEEVVAVCSLDEPYGFICRLGIGTGLRWSDLRRLTAGQVRRGALEVATEKTGAVVRIPIAPELVEEIAGRVGLLVCLESPGNFARRVRKLAGVPTFHVHRMRHPFARRWLDRGGSLEALQRMLGHGSIRTTERYARMSDAVVEEQARRVHAEQTSTQKVLNSDVAEA